MIRDDIVACALAQIGKPYALQAWGPHSFDCVGLVGFAGKQSNVFSYELSKDPDPEIRCYSNNPDPPVMLKFLKQQFVRVAKEDTLLGDSLWFRAPRAQHLGIITKIENGVFWCVHADIIKYKVRLQRVRNSFYVICGWRYPELSNE